MGFEMVKEKYSGSIKEVQLGKGDQAIKVGGESCLPFYQFEGDMANKPKIAMEVWDIEPPEWPESARAPFKDVLSDPAKWAKKCAEEYGADMIALQLRSTDPNDKDASPEEAVATVKKVLEAVNIPVVVWGTANVDKDAAVLKKVAEECDGENLIIGPVEDANHKAIGAAIMGYGHTAIASSPIDINLAKQVNILLENLGISLDHVVIDPTTGGLGYGMEYSYSVMERIKLAALTFGDDKLQLPIINNLAFGVCNCKDAKEPVEEAPQLGDPERRGVMMESVAAVSYIMAGSNILILRHPETVRLVRSFMELLDQGGTAEKVKPVNKLLPEAEIDYASLSPEPDLTIKEEAKKAPPKKEAPPKEEKKPEPAEAKKEEKKAEPAAAEKEEKKAEPAAEAKKEEAKPADEEKLRAELEEKIRREVEDKVRKEAEVKAKMEAESKAKPEEEEKAKAERAKKEAEAKAKAEEEAKAKAKEELRAKLKKDEDAIRKQVQDLKAKQKEEKVEILPDDVPRSGPDRILHVLNHIHKRAA